MLRILIADDHEVIRRGLKLILQEEFSLVHIDEAADTDTLVRKAGTGQWDVIISDLAMPGGGGLDALVRIRREAPPVPILILSIYPEEQYALPVIRAGASGYLNKDAAPEELVNAVQRLLAGRRYITSVVTRQLISSLCRSSEPPPDELLDEKELTILQMTLSGSTIPEIAGQLSLENTAVSTCLSHILSKMNIRNQDELTGMNWNILDLN